MKRSGHSVKPAMTVLLVILAGSVVAGAIGPKAPDDRKQAPAKAKVLFLHHSTGECIWNGGVEAWFDDYNKANATEYRITQRNFPESEPYGWNNYPYDYWNIWVRHAGDSPYNDEPTLEMLTPLHDVIVFKHCFPVSAIEPDIGSADAASEDKRIENYKLQYAALKKKLRAFPKTNFVLWTGAALVEGETAEPAARRAGAFFDWVRRAWDEPGDNIFLWDFRALETEGGLYLKPAYATSDSHPNETFSRTVAPLFCRRIVDVIRGRGDVASITGGDIKQVAKAQPAGHSPKPDEPRPAEVRPAVKHHSKMWVFDDAEDPKRLERLWGSAAAYADDAKDRVVEIRFSEGRQEDWGEYGQQRIATTKAPKKSDDISQYGFLAFRARADRDMEVVVTLITKPDSRPSADESFFGFSAYLHPKPGGWQWFVLDLAKLELSVEGEKAYAAAGKPARPMRLTGLRFVTSKKNENARFVVDDIAFHRTRPQTTAGEG